jgi:precorrin-8X/cobalt-precorrin-8 methylmutase
MTRSRIIPHPLSVGLPCTGEAIEQKSFQIIEDALFGLVFNANDKSIVSRVVHATGDVSIAPTMRIHPDAFSRGLSALKNDCDIFCDVHMLQVGITRTPNRIYCAIRDEAVALKAKAEGTTRAAAAMSYFGERLNGAIVAIGNAPTAIWKLLNLHETKGITPSLVIGLPVGFVGAAESKQALYESDLVYITNEGTRGGSPLAAAAMNAIAIAAKQKESHDISR